MSATSVLNNLDKEKFNVLAVGIKKDGSWHLYPGPTEGLCTGEWEACKENIPVAFCPGSGMKGLVAFENGRVRELPVDVVFPCLLYTSYVLFCFIQFTARRLRQQALPAYPHRPAWQRQGR